MQCWGNRINGAENQCYDKTNDLLLSYYGVGQCVNNGTCKSHILHMNMGHTVNMGYTMNMGHCEYGALCEHEAYCEHGALL